MKNCCKKSVALVLVILIWAGNIFAHNLTDSDYTLLLEWGTYGTGDGQFRFPNGLCIDNKGYVYVSDGGYNSTSNHRIQKFLSDGTFITKWGSQGSGNGQFQNRILGITTDSQYIYVVDHDNYRIQKFSLDGSFVLKWGSYGSGNGQFRSAHGIAIDPYNYIYVVDDVNHRVQKFTLNGIYVTQWNCGNSPRQPACDASGYVYITDHFDHKVRKYDSEGNFIVSWGEYGTGNGQFSYPSGIGCDKLGYIYVCDQHNSRVQKFTANGDFVTKWFAPGWYVTIDNKGYVYVTGAYNCRVQKFGVLPCTLQATIDIKPDVLNLKSHGRWITCYVELPKGYSVEDIDTSTVALAAIDNKPIESPLYREGPTEIGDYDEDGIPDLMVKFNRQDIIDTLRGRIEPPADVELTVSGELTNGKFFEGSDIIHVINPGGGSQTDRQGNLPHTFNFYENFPNPFSSNTTIRYALPTNTHVKIDIYNESGRVVKSFINRKMEAGYHSDPWDGRDNADKDLPSGVYFIKFKTEQLSETRKLLLIR